MFEYLAEKYMNECAKNGGDLSKNYSHVSVLFEFGAWLDNQSAQHRIHQTAFGVMAAAFFLGVAVGAIAINAVCGGW